MTKLEQLRDALFDIPDDIAVPVEAGLARDLLAVADAAGAFIELDGCEATTFAAVATRNALRDALARLDTVTGGER